MTKILENKHTFPTSLTEGSVFADDTNNVYPLDNEDTLRKSAKALADSDFLTYSEKERYFIISRIKNEAETKNILDNEIKECLTVGGTMKTYNEEDFEKKVKAQVEAKIDEFKSTFDEKKEADKVVTEYKSQIEDKDKEITTLTEGKESLESKASELTKTNDELTAKIRDRDRTIKVSEAFAEVNLDDEKKKNRIEHVLTLTTDKKDTDFEEFLKAEVEFYNGLPKVDLVEGSKGDPKPPNSPKEVEKTKAEKRTDKIEEFINRK